jgi:hypothetical protein
MGYAASHDSGVIVARKPGGAPLAIAVHDDPDFWIADDGDWFATGKQKPSPANEAIAAAAACGGRAALYLAESNIMNLDALRREWESRGLRVISSLHELNAADGGGA